MTVEEFEKKIKMWGDLCGLPTDTSSGKGQDAFDALKKVLSDDDIDEMIIDTNIGVACQNYLLKNGLDGMIKFVVSVVMSLQKMHNEELAAVKGRYHWRKHSEDSVPNTSEDIEWTAKYRLPNGEWHWASGVSSCREVKGYYDSFENKDVLFWRPVSYSEVENGGADGVESAQ